jgi:hypothetical protein
MGSRANSFTSCAPQLLLFFELGFNPPPTPESVSPEIDRHILLLRMEGRCSLESISQIIRQLGLPFSSIGYISQRLQAYAQGLPQVALAGAVIMVILCDEIFTLGQPILLTVEPRSLAILKIELVEKRDAETWKKHWEENINSALRQFLATCRGQVTQEMPELFAYVHNHRRFVRGKRAGQAPLEILTGTKLEKTWLESLLELEAA